MKLLPGVDQNRTLALNEAAISASQLIRFVPDKQGIGLVQKLGGWTRYFPSNVGSTVRALWAWQDTNAIQYLALGSQPRRVVVVSLSNAVVGPTNYTTINYSGDFSFSVGDSIVVSGVVPSGYNGTKTLTGATYNPATSTGAVTFAETNYGALTTAGILYATDGLSEISDGTRQILSPKSETENAPVSASTVAGSALVTITDAGSSIYSSDTVDIKTPISVGGLVLFGLYETTYVDGLNQYIVTATDVLGEPQAATSTVTSGGAVPLYQFTSNTATVNVTLANHGYLAGDTFAALVATSFGGITVFGNYTIVSVSSTNVFTIQSSTVASAFSVTGASWSGGTATVTFSGSGVSFRIGDTITITGISPSGYNVSSATVTASSADSVSYALASNPGAYVSGGSIAYVATAYENSGNAQFVYYRTPGPLPTSTGYGVGGYGVGGYGTGVAPTILSTGNAIYADDWSLDNWGQVLIACPAGGAIYTWDPSVGVAQATIISNAPPVNDGVFVAMPQRQIVAWGSTSTGIQDPLLIRWCDVNDYSTWIDSPTNQAGSYRLPKGSKVVGCIQGPQQGIVWTDLAVWAMQYVGPPYVYQFNEIGTGCGLIARKAAASMNGVIYWMSQSQFYKMGTGGVEPIFCPIWDVIFQDLDTSNLDKIRIAPNSRFGEIAWYYPTAGNGGEVSHYVKYNVNLNAWDFGELSRTAWINQSVLGPPIGAGPSGTSNLIYQHETSTDADGSAMISNFQTGFYQLTEGEFKLFIDQIWPDMKWGYYGGAQDADLTITFYVTDYAHETPRVYGPYPFNNQTDFITPRFRGRFISIALESSDVGSFWRIGGTKYRFQQDGKF